MSKVDQAKKEAKRLFNLAKKNNNNSIKIQNLSQAKEILSTINGYKHWYEYELNLQKQDIEFYKFDKRNQINKENELLNNIGYFNQNIPFNTVPAKEIKPIIFKEQLHTIITLAKKEKTFYKEEKKWILDQYPLLISGTAGSGKTEYLLSLIGQYISNKEGVIYFDGKGDCSIHAKFFSYCKEYDRLQDYYVLNFLSTNLEYNKNLSHTIDPINNMVGCLEYFEYFFGKFGTIIHEIIKESHNNEKFMTIEGLESILMLNNLISWNNENRFKTPLIKEYLLSIGINEESDINSFILENHAKNLSIAYDSIQLFKMYPNVFKVQTDNYFKEGYLGHVDMQKIFSERKILLVILPDLEKSNRLMYKLADLISYQIKFVESKFNLVHSHFQNIVIDDAKYIFKDFFKDHLVKTSNNYIFSINQIEFNSDIEQFLLSLCKTKFILKNEISDISTTLKLEIINNIKELPKFDNHSVVPFIEKESHKFDNYSHLTFIERLIRELRYLKPFNGYIICKNKRIKNNKYIINNENVFYFEKVKAYYQPAKIVKNIYLINHNNS